jgi:hypothetical protein
MANFNIAGLDPIGSATIPSLGHIQIITVYKYRLEISITSDTFKLKKIPRL